MEESGTAHGIDRRRLLGWGGLAAAGVVAAGAAPAGAAPHPPGDDRIPPDTLPGGAYDRYLANLAAEGEFSGVVLLSHRGRTVLSRSYGMADEERGIANHEGTAFSLSSAGKPFRAVALLQLAQRGELRLSDPVGAFLTGFPKDIAEQVTVYHVLSGTSGLNGPDEDVQRVFTSREEVLEYNEQWARRAKLVSPPGTPTDHAGAEVAISAQIVAAVAGTTYWDYVEEHIFRRCGMTGTAFCTRPQWLTDEHIAHPYMTAAGGGQVDAVRHLDQSSPLPYVLGKNPGRAFIDAPGDGGFATAPDLVRVRERAARRHGAGAALRRVVHRTQDPARRCAGWPSGTRHAVVRGLRRAGPPRRRPVGDQPRRRQPRRRRRLDDLPGHRLGRRHPRQPRRPAAAGSG
ncbi:serine hydrolase domain-containing protein [Amycolatopsis australiensis]|uniref:Beta-lactamase n=1 Tax=Amycolatopsis australiensis TaxID=546364 RepID=A0A1K1SNH1_9PSEU|nr:serine hydrolase domain-containing protein [Amycolatopsis australiensis]SFW85822.1 Beta-lactamase [Amycolatopsis australiensis]